MTEMLRIKVMIPWLLEATIMKALTMTALFGVTSVITYYV